MYINLSLYDIFDSTIDKDYDADGHQFDKIYILAFGDLLQLHPILQNPPFIPISIKIINKYLKWLYAHNIWENLMKY